MPPRFARGATAARNPTRALPRKRLLALLSGRRLLLLLLVLRLVGHGPRTGLLTTQLLAGHRLTSATFTDTRGLLPPGRQLRLVRSEVRQTLFLGGRRLLRSSRWLSRICGLRRFADVTRCRLCRLCRLGLLPGRWLLRTGWWRRCPFGLPRRRFRRGSGIRLPSGRLARRLGALHGVVGKLLAGHLRRLGMRLGLLADGMPERERQQGKAQCACAKSNHLAFLLNVRRLARGKASAGSARDERDAYGATPVNCSARGRRPGCKGHVRSCRVHSFILRHWQVTKNPEKR